MSQDLLNDVKITIKAVLTLCGDTALGLTELSRDYKSHDGSDIPYRQLGYSSLLSFLRTIPDTVRLSRPESPDTLIYSVSDSKTDHIKKLVQGQKDNRKPKKYGRGPPPRRRFDNFTSRPMRNLAKEESITDNFREDALYVLKNNSEGLPFSEFDYHVRRVVCNQRISIPFHEIYNDLNKFINIEGKRVFLRKDIPVVNRNDTVHHQPPRSHLDNLEFSASNSECDFEDDFEDDFDVYSPNSSVFDENVAESTSYTKLNLTNGNNAEPESNFIDDMSEIIIPPKVVKNIQTLLEAEENRNGIWLRDLLPKYLMKFNYDLKPEEFGFADALELVGSLKHVVHLKRYRLEGDHLLVDARQVKPVVHEDTGNIPMSFINNLKKILTKRSVGSLCTNDLPAEYKRHAGCTLDPKEFGFSSMDSFLKNLEESCSDFCFRHVKDRIFIRLNSIPLDAKTNQNGNVPAILPNGPELNPFPVEVCNADSKLPSDPLFDSLQKSDVFRVELAEVYSPWRFFIHHVDNITTLDRMMDDLNSFYMENEKEYEVLPFTAVKGLLCACTYSANNKWHRVSIINTKLKTAKVKFVDYGTVEEVNVNRLRYLHREFAVDHAMCVKAKLTCVQPKNIVDPEAKNEHSSKLNNFFYQIASSGDLEATFINFDAKNDCYEISLRCLPEKIPPFSLSDHLYNENLVDIKSEEFAELLTSDAVSSLFFTPESLQPSKKTEQQSRSKPVNGKTTKKPTSSSSSTPVAPVVSPPPPQLPPPQKGPPPGLRLPSGTQSQNYNYLFSPPLTSKSNEASNVGGSKKKIIPKKNAELYGSPLIAQPSMLNPPFGPAPVNVPPAYMAGLSCATSFNPLLMPQSLQPFGIAPSMSSSYASPGFSQYASPYFLNYSYQPPLPVFPATPNPFSQFAPPPPSAYVRPPPGFGPLKYPSPLPQASPYSQPDFSPVPSVSCQIGTKYSDHLPNRSCSYKPLVTIASTTGSTTNKFKWPLADPELASQWEKKRSESVISEDSGCRKDSEENEAVLSSLQQTEDPLLTNVSALNLDAKPNQNLSAVQETLAAGSIVPDASTYEDLIEVEKARERKGAESTLKKCFNFSPSSEVIENVLTLLETQAKPQTSGANDVTLLKKATESMPMKDTTATTRTSWTAPAAPSSPSLVSEPLTSHFWDPKPRTQLDDIKLSMNGMLDKFTEHSKKSKVSTLTSREVDCASSPLRELRETSTPMTYIASVCSGVSPKTLQKTSKLDSIKQMVMQKRK